MNGLFSLTLPIACLLFTTIAQGMNPPQEEDVSIEVRVTGFISNAESERVLNANVQAIRLECKAQEATCTFEHTTNADGMAALRMQRGPAVVVVTGEDTERHWSTGSCAIDAVDNLLVEIELRVDEVVHICNTQTAPEASDQNDGEPTEGDVALDQRD